MCFPSVLEATLVFTTILEISFMRVFFHDCRGNRTCTDAATSPSIAKYGVYRNFPKKGSSNRTDKDYGLYSTLRIGALMYLFL